MTRHRYYCENCHCGLGGDLDNPSANYKCGIHNFETGERVSGVYGVLARVEGRGR